MIVLLVLSAQFARAVSVGRDELAEARQWATAKFQGTQPPPPAAEPGLFVQANHDRVQKNARGGKPMHLVQMESTHGLYCHAFSKIIVRLPAPGQSFSAIVGVDSNEQTSGGRGSVDFSVTVGQAEKFRSGVMHEGMSGKAVNVDLGGATEFVLQVDETPDGIACDQSDWAEAKVTLQDGRVMWLADLPLFDKRRAPYSTDLPFSFTYDGKPSVDLLKTWKLARDSRPLDQQRTEHTLTWTEPNGGLQVRCVGVEYHDFPTIEWTLYFKNLGTNDAPVLADIQALDTRFERNAEGDFVLHHNKGTFVRADDFEPLQTVLNAGQKERFVPPAGRPCGHVWPYFNLELPGEGVIVVVGWPGQWAAEFARDAGDGCRVVAGQELTRLKLRPGEEVRTPAYRAPVLEGRLAPRAKRLAPVDARAQPAASRAASCRRRSCRRAARTSSPR